MAEQSRTDRESSQRPERTRKTYKTPTIEAYGHVAKLTQSGGTTMNEPGNPLMMTGCL